MDVPVYGIAVALICHAVFNEDIDGSIVFLHGLFQIVLLEVGQVDRQPLGGKYLSDAPAHDAGADHQDLVFAEVFFHR